MKVNRFHATCLALLLLSGASAAMADDALEQAVQAQYDAHLEALFKHFHRNPELSNMENRTAARLAEELREAGFQVTEGVGGTGIVALLDNGPGPLVMLRADMDGLPVKEKTGLPYASEATQVNRDGERVPVMHACGHDVHITSMVGTARIMAATRERWSGTLMLIGQPAEERIIGARQMMEDDLWERFGTPDYALAFHVSSGVPTGKIVAAMGAAYSGADSVDIYVPGVGAHGAAPHTGIDPVVLGSQIVLGLQTVVSRNVPVSEPAVVSVTQIHGGTADNVIPEQVDLVGTIRTFHPDVRALAARRVREIAESTAHTFGCTAEVDVSPGYPVLVNDPAETERSLAAARRLGFEPEQLVTVAPQGGGEDFSYFCEKVPGCFAYLGARDEAHDCMYPHHHPRFNVDESMLCWGAGLHAQVALDAGT